MNRITDPTPFSRDQLGLDKSPLQIRAILSQPIWRELRTFLAVAKSPSYARAAELLGTSAPTVSRDVKRLQDQIGAQLVVSTFSGVQLTEVGRKLAKHVAELDFHLSALSSNIRQDDDAVAGRVVISVTSGLAVAIVTPAVGKLHQRYPLIELDIREQASLLNFENNQADLVISLTAVSRGDIECRQIGVLHLVPMASRDYIKARGVPTKMSIDQHVLLQCSYYESDRGPWQAWNALVNAGQLTHRSENSLSYFVLVKGGAGVGLLGTYVLVDPALVPIELDVRVALPIYVISVADRLKSRPVAAVQDWLVSLFSENGSFEPVLTFPDGGFSGEEALKNLLEAIAPAQRRHPD